MIHWEAGNLSRCNQNRSKIDTISIKIVKKSTKIRSWRVWGPFGLPRSVLWPFWTPIGVPHGIVFEAKWGSCWGHVGSKIDFRRSWMAFKSVNDVTLLNSFGTDVGSILGSKMEPKSVQDRSQERSWSKCKNPQKHLQELCVWGCGWLKSNQKSS